MAGILGIIDVESYKKELVDLGACISSVFTPQATSIRDGFINEKIKLDASITEDREYIAKLNALIEDKQATLDAAISSTNKSDEIQAELNDLPVDIDNTKKLRDEHKNILENEKLLRQARLDQYIANTKLFYPFPESLEELLKTDSVLSGQFTTINDFIEALPSITIRSYFINSALLEALSLIASNIGNNDGTSWEALKNKGKSAIDCFKALAQVGGLNALRQKLVNSFGNKYGVSQSASVNLYQLPEILYYRLTTTITNNTYNIPCEINSGFFDSRSVGWGENRHLFGGEPSKSKLLTLLKQTNGLDVMPTFNVKTGSNDTDKLQISLDLINDTDTAAAANTQFIRSLHLVNQWIQYGVFQFPGNLYDISIPGTGQRWFMCTANISVKPKGSIRYIGNNSKFSNLGLTATELDEFRIPDVYSLTIDFTSLIPNNLNNFLLAKVANGNDFMDKQSFLPKLLENLKTALMDVKSLQDKVNSVKKSYTDTINQVADEASLNEYAKENVGLTDTTGSDDDRDVTKSKAYRELADTYAQELETSGYGGKDTDNVKYLADKLARDAIDEIDEAIANKRAKLIEEKKPDIPTPEDTGTKAPDTSTPATDIPPP